MKNKIFPMIILSILLLSSTVNTQIASGGNYTLEQSVIAAGGGASAGGVYKVEGTSGQAAAGTPMTNVPYRQIGGFWTPLLLAPTAAPATVGGQVITESGMGIKGAMITLTGGLLTAPRIALTNNFGYFAFDDVESGHFYVLTVLHKKYGFAQNNQAFTLLEDRRDIVFQANWEN